MINAKDSWDFLLKWLEYTRKNLPFNFWIDLRGFLIGQSSYPYYTDFARWGREIANLSRTYPHLTGFSIDDFCMPQTQEMLATQPRELAEVMMQECWRINPKIQFFPIVYPHSIHLVEPCKDYVSGIIYYNWTSGDCLAAAKATLPGKKVIAGIYAKVCGNENPPQDVEKCMLAAKSYADGMMIFNVPRNDPDGPIGQVVRSLFNRWNPTRPPRANIFSKLLG
jgi:hypothetical protein